MKTFEQVLAENRILKTQKKSLEKKNEDLKNEKETLENEQKQLKLKLQWYEEQLKLNRAQKYGKSSEKGCVGQISLFNEAEEEASSSVPEPELEDVVIKEHKRKKKRNPKDIYENLPVERIEHDIPEKDKVCPECGENMHKMSEEIVRHIEVIPAQYKVVEDVYPIYACRNCEKNNTKTPIVMAEKKKQLIPRSLVSPSLMAYIMSQKFVNSLPLYRQEQELKRNGLQISRQTMANWVIAGAALLKPLHDHMHEELIKKEILHADETELEVLHEVDRRYDMKSYMWLYRTSGYDDKPIVIYDYQEGRSGLYAKEFLDGFRGYIHTDAWSGYNRLRSTAKLCGCWAHMRRKFTDALKILKDPPKDCPEKKGAAYCDKLFKIEEKGENYTTEERFKLREAESKPVMDAFFAWVKEEMEKRAVTQNMLGKAFTYAVNQEEKLRRVLEDGRIELSNNRAERSIKPFVIGRKNWLFCNTPKGAKSSAIVYSIIETAKENGLKPYEYLKWVFEQITEGKTQPEELAAWDMEVRKKFRTQKSEDKA